MKKNWNIMMLVLLLCFSGGLLGSCTDEMEGNSTNGSDKITVRVQFSTKADGTSVTDREKLNDNEYRIRSIRLYAFDGEKLDNMVYKSGLNNVTGVESVNIDVMPANNKTFYVVVNEPDNDAIHSALALANHPNGIKQVQYSIANYLNSDINALTESEKYFLPMYKEQNAAISKTSTGLTIGVDRALARIDVYMIKAAGITTEAKTDNATLKVERSNGSGYIASDNVVSADPALNFDINNSVATTLGNYTTDYTGYEKIFSFYVPEQTCNDEADRLKFTLGDIEWGGHQMSAPYNSFYLGNDVLKKITRNTVYRIYCRIKPTTKDVTFNIVTMPWGVVPTQSEQTEKEPINMVNCYMVAPGGSVTIPVQNVYRFWSWSDDLPDPEPISKEMEVVPEVIWTDTEDLITSVELLDIPNLTDKKDHARIRVHTTPGKQGNAVIGMRMKTEDGTLEPDYRWSWHVWVTDYNPEIINQTNNGYVFMDRSLGSFANIYDERGSSLGTLYQWGRKDPFPGPVNWKDEPVLFGEKIDFRMVNVVNNLSNSIKAPNCFYQPSTDGVFDWFTNGTVSNQNRNLWSLNNKKTIYDPCPEGWKVPLGTNVEYGPWKGFTNTWKASIKGVENSLGYFPTHGGRLEDGTLDGMPKARTVAYLWYNTDYWEGEAAVLGFSGLQATLTHVYKACANPVRCVKE